MSYGSNSPSLRYPKMRPRVLDRRDKQAALKRKDHVERSKCHLRSGMRCEVVLMIGIGTLGRCRGRVTENHHLLGGNGRRNVGKSILAEWRLDTCTKCHRLIGAKLLVPTNKHHSARTVGFQRLTDWKTASRAMSRPKQK